MQTIHHTASFTHSNTLCMKCEVLLHAVKILCTLLQGHLPKFVSPNVWFLMSHIWKLISQCSMCEHCEELSAFQLLMFLPSVVPPHLFQTSSWRSEYAINWFHWNTFSRNFLISKGDFDWERKDYSFENICCNYPTTGKSDNHLAYSQYPWNCKTLSVIQF